MREIFAFLSGPVPGGLFLLSFLLLALNLALYFFYKSSKLFPKEIYNKKVWRYNLFILIVYIFFWFYLRPADLPDKVLIVPFQYGTKVEYRICESVENRLRQNLAGDQILHRWEWFYNTAEQDSLASKSYRKHLANKLGISVIISGEISELHGTYNLDLEIDRDDESHKIAIKAGNISQATEQIINNIRRHSSILKSPISSTNETQQFDLEQYLQAKCAILDKKYDRTLELLDESNFKYQLLISQALLGKGIKHIPKESKSTLKERIINPYFQRIKQILFPYSKKGEDTADLNLILGRMYLHEKDYEMAEVCLKKALAQDRYNARVYYDLSYLNVDRVKELKFKDRIDILEYCIKLDPGFSAAVYELANEYYISGTGVPTSSGTQNAIASLQAFLKINPNQPDILSLLGKIYVQSKYTREAVSTYTRLLDLYPNVAENNYNLGICYFHMKDYKRAEELFQKAIEISDYSDSYLYLGAIYRLSEDWDRALYYFRERIKRKEGADDRYAKEAMRGVRIILSKQQGDSSEEMGNYK